MEFYLILARSVTFAQRMSTALEQIGIRCQIYRAPTGLTERGCAYALKIRVDQMPEVFPRLHETGLVPLKIFLYQSGAYHEVSA